MQLGYVLAEGAATSTTHRTVSAKRAQGDGYRGVSEIQNGWRMKFGRRGKINVQKDYATEEAAVQARDDLAWEFDHWCDAYCLPLPRFSGLLPPDCL